MSPNAKIMEKLVKHQLMSHFANNNLICSSQFAYLNKHSTQIAVTDECCRNISRRRLSLLAQKPPAGGFLGWLWAV